ncbi:hypothetical protein LTR04_003072, partial [Oleoguttula sp. CCFEE 6159]
YLNGSILIAVLAPSFTILHTLTTSRGPAKITGLSWHGSSSKQKAEMLATQTSSGDVHVFSIPKAPHTETPNIIRVLNKSEDKTPGPCWFGWSKAGRIVQYSEGETRACDVRTKTVTYDAVPTIDGVTGIAHYGPTATLFTLGRNHTVQQYDLTPANIPMLVANVQHVPGNAPPSPPNSIEEQKKRHATPATTIATAAPVLPVYLDTDTSEEEGNVMSPLQKIAQEMDQLEDERRDQVGPLSPISSKASSVSSRSSHGERKARRRYDHYPASVLSGRSDNDETEFSYGSSVRSGHESVSIRSTSSAASSKYKSSSLRREILRSPEEAKQTLTIDLFPFVKTRLSDVQFRAPQYGQSQRTPDLLRQQMLSVVFGWEHDIELLIRDELSRHAPGSASGVLLSKWLGDFGADVMASMVGSESMTSSDWMLLALSSMGQDSQKKVGEAFVHRLLEKGDIHPAVAILLGLGEPNDAVEVYVSRQYFMEAVLLTCLVFPAAWQRQSHLVRKWGEVAVAQGQPELAVRCFSCTSIESSEPWFSPRAQDAVFAAQREQTIGPSMLSPPLSPPSATGSSRMTAKNAALKLITTFGDKEVPKPASIAAERTPHVGIADTPIADSALSPEAAGSWLRPAFAEGSARDPSSARTATPGAYKSRKRFPSKSGTSRTREAPADSTPMAVPGRTVVSLSGDESHGSEGGDEGNAYSHRRKNSRTVQLQPSHSLSAAVYQSDNPTSRDSSRLRNPNALPSPAQGVFARLKEQSRTRNGSRERKPGDLHLDMVDVVVVEESLSALPTASDSIASGSRSRTGNTSPPLTGDSTRITKGRAIDQYISSLEEANFHARQHRPESRQRGESREGRTRNRDDLRELSSVRYINPAKRSPSSPVPMSPSASYDKGNAESYDDERDYKVISPTDYGLGQTYLADESLLTRRCWYVLGVSQPAGRRAEPLAGNAVLGASASEKARAAAEAEVNGKRRDPLRVHHPLHCRWIRRRSNTMVTLKAMIAVPIATLRERDAVLEAQVAVLANAARALGASPRRIEKEAGPRRPGDHSSRRNRVSNVNLDRFLPRDHLANCSPGLALSRLKQMNHKPGGEGKNLLPGSWKHAVYHSLADRRSDGGITRSQTVDPEAMSRHYPKTSGTSTSSTPIGLPATPRAMRHPRYMSADPHERENIPSVAESPDNLGLLNPVTYKSDASSNDQLAPLLPSTVFGQKGPQAPPRSASVPLEMSGGGSLPSHPAFRAAIPSSSNRRRSLSRGHVRRISPNDVQILPPHYSPPPITASIDGTLRDSQVIIVEPEDPPPILAELQHLAGPPPPPPPPSMFNPGHAASGSLSVINIAIEETSPMIVEVPPTERATTASPSMYRRGRGSMSDNVGGKLRTVAEKIRANSRSRAKSPPMDSIMTSPYETVLPPIPRRDSVNRARPPMDRAGSSASLSDAIPPPPPPPPAPPSHTGVGAPSEPTMFPEFLPARSYSAMSGYRNPREIRANMPPEQLQQGVYQPTQGGMI